MSKHHVAKKWFFVVALSFVCVPAFAEALKPVEHRSYRPYPPIEVTSYVFDRPRPIRAWSAKVDLSSPDVQIVVTPRGNVGPHFETACATTLEFAESAQVQLAVNATPYDPLRDESGQGMDISGLSASDGDIYSEPDDQFGAIVFDASGRGRIITAPYTPAKLAGVDDGVGGFRVLVKGGKSVAGSVATYVPPDFAGVNPRTAAGLSADGRTLWLIVVDGRNPGRSEGVTLEELGDFGVLLGCDTLLNLEGGGSSTMVLQDPASKQWRVINQPVGRKRTDTLRPVANNLGVKIKQTKTAP